MNWTMSLNCIFVHVDEAHLDLLDSEVDDTDGSVLRTVTDVCDRSIHRWRADSRSGARAEVGRDNFWESRNFDILDWVFISFGEIVRNLFQVSPHFGRILDQKLRGVHPKVGVTLDDVVTTQSRQIQVN